MLPSLSQIITVAGLAIAFVLFVAMAAKEFNRARSRALHSLKFQLALATFVWLIGESLTVAYAVTYGEYEELLEIHTISMGIFALIVLARLPQLMKRYRHD